jgi:hypothetical protein
MFSLYRFKIRMILFVKKHVFNMQIIKNSIKNSFYKTSEHSSFTGTPACGSRAANLTRVLIKVSFIKLMF